MDESKSFISDETDAQNKSEKENETGNENQLCVTEDEIETENKLWKEELDAPNENQKSHAEFEPKLKRICKESENYPECNLEKYEGENAHQRPGQRSETNSSGYATGIADKVNYSMTEKNKYVRKIMQKYLKRARTNPTGTIKNYRSIRRDGKKQKTMISKSIPPQILAKKKRCISQMDKCIEISKEEGIIPQIEVQGFEDSKSEVTNTGKTKPKTGKLKKLKTKPSAIHKLKYRSGKLSKDVALFSSSTESARTTTYKSGRISRSSEVRSSEEVLAHFRSFMQSKNESFDKSMEDYSGKRDTKAISEPDNQPSKYPADVVTATANLDFKVVMGSGMTEEPGKRKSETLTIHDDSPEALIKTTRRVPRQRIIYDEKVEYTRWRVIQQIKDKEIALKFRIMEGKYSKDLETKLRCIEKAKCMQSEIDIYFAILDDHKKLLNIPKQLKRCSMPAEKSAPKSPRKDEKDKKRKEKPIKTFTSLFSDLYISSLSESKNEDIYESINPRRFMSAYNEYLECKKKQESVSQRAEHTAKSAVNDFYRTLMQCQSKMQDKIPLPQNRSVEDYQNYVNDLRKAVKENLNCLKSLIPPATSVIFPLMGSLSQSRKKILEIFAFLGQERSDVFQ